MGTIRIKRTPKGDDDESPRIGRRGIDPVDLKNYHPEALLISAVLTTGQIHVPIDQGITADHLVVHPGEWDWILNYHAEHRSVPSLAAFLGQFGRFRYIDTDEVNYATSAVMDAWGSRRMARAIRQGAELLQAKDQDSALALVSSELRAIEIAKAPAGAARSSIAHSDDTFAYVESVVERVRDQGAAGISTGFELIDARTGGFMPGQLWVPAARLGNGKSWFMLRAAAEAVMAGKRVHYWSMEMPRTQIDMRFHVIISQLLDGNKSDLHESELRFGTASLTSYQQFLGRMRRKVDGDFFVRAVKRGPSHPRNIAAAVEQGNPDIVFVDYLQLLEPDEQFRERGWQSVASISRSLKQIAMSYDIPVVAASQINRNGAGKRPPRAEDLSQADGIGQDADAVFTMKQHSRSVIEGHMAKLRGGGSSGWATWFQFFPDVGEVEEITAAEAQELMDEDLVDDD